MKKCKEAITVTTLQVIQC